MFTDLSLGKNHYSNGANNCGVVDASRGGAHSSRIMRMSEDSGIQTYQDFVYS